MHLAPTSALCCCDRTNTTPACSDGIDNDGDTFTDFGSDTECSSSSDNREDI